MMPQVLSAEHRPFAQPAQEGASLDQTFDRSDVKVRGLLQSLVEFAQLWNQVAADAEITLRFQIERAGATPVRLFQLVVNVPPDGRLLRRVIDVGDDVLRVFAVPLGQTGDEVTPRAILLVVGAGMIYRQHAD